MHWLIKSTGFKILSAIPGGAGLYTFAQDRITKSSHPNRARVEQKISVGLQYWNWLKENNRSRQLLDGQFLDYGAGWHPTIPLLCHSFGVKRQWLLDISPWINAGRAAGTLKFFREVVGDPAWRHRADLERVPGAASGAEKTAHEILGPLGIEYFAPYPETFRAEPNSVDVIFCTQVLQHIPREVQLGIFREWEKLLKPGGLVLGTVHHVGHFGDPNNPVRRYDHLKYSPATWERFINSRMMSFNRLKARDYRAGLESVGLRIAAFNVQPGDEADLAALARVRVHESFGGYTREELAARNVFFVAEKP